MQTNITHPLIALLVAARARPAPSLRGPLAVFTLIAFILLATGSSRAFAATDVAANDAREAVVALLGSSDNGQRSALRKLRRNWSVQFAPALLEIVSLSREPELSLRILELLQDRSGERIGYDLNAWFAWVWQQEVELPPWYASFKAQLYGRIDRRFAAYFEPPRSSSVRLDEVRWGGVVQDGIPPLRNPAMIAADEAAYLDDDNTVFGLVVNGDARAYPKRILAWHEMFTDTVGGVPVTGVYCTLCGSMILYESIADGREYLLGTSGFLYRSNKLMYDQATQSLWNTLWGRPVIGPLVGKGITLPRRSVVTTTWGEWRRRHPASSVLSLETGFQRDYGEGVAYRDYFSSDELMFNSAEHDDRLANKAEVLGLVFNDTDARPLAISADYAREHPLIRESVGSRQLIVVTDKSGAMRAYESGGKTFEAWDGDRTLRDRSGTNWTLREDRLVSDNGDQLTRLPSHSAFWFGWYGAYSSTRLLH